MLLNVAYGNKKLVSTFYLYGNRVETLDHEQPCSN